MPTLRLAGALSFLCAMTSPSKTCTALSCPFTFNANSVPKSSNLTLGACMRKPLAAGGTCTRTRPLWQRTSQAETISIWATPSINTVAPLKNSICASPLFSVSLPGAMVSPLRTPSMAKSASNVWLIVATPSDVGSLSAIFRGQTTIASRTIAAAEATNADIRHLVVRVKAAGCLSLPVLISGC